MSRLATVIVASAGGAFGWWVGSFVGLLTAFMLGVAGTAAGTYVGGRLARHYLQ